VQPTEPLSLRERLRAPKAAAIAGIVCSVLLIISLVLILNSLAFNPGDALTSPLIAGKNTLLALNLIPFAGIAFLWFIGAVRDRLGDREDQFFATVFFGSGLLFLAMLFAASAVAGSLLLLYEVSDPVIASTYYTPARTVARVIMNTYGIRMAGVFMISICTLFLRSRAVPRWMALLGYGLAAIMLLRIGAINRLGWVFMLFPLWIILISVYILIDNYRNKTGATLT
jgi:hypothetical protein